MNTYLNWLFVDNNSDGDVININNRNRTRSIRSTILFMLSQPPIDARVQSPSIKIYTSHNLIHIKRLTKEIDTN